MCSCSGVRTSRCTWPWPGWQGKVTLPMKTVSSFCSSLAWEKNSRPGSGGGPEARRPPSPPPPPWPRPSPSGRGQMGKCRSQWGRWLQGAAGPSPSSLHPARGKEASPYHPPAQAACAQLPPGACSGQDWPQHSLSPQRQSRQAARPRAAPREGRPSERARVTAFSSSGPLRLGPGLCPSSQKSYLQPLNGIAH